MRSMKPFAVVVMICLLISGCAHHHHHHPGEGRLSLDDLPETVRDHFNRDHPNVVVKGVERETQGGVTHYEVTYADHGEVHETVYDREGDEIKPDNEGPQTLP